MNFQAIICNQIRIKWEPKCVTRCDLHSNEWMNQLSGEKILTNQRPIDIFLFG